MRYLWPVLTLTGCASVGALSEAAPSATYLSAKSADTVERCLADNLDDLVGGPAVSRGQSGTRLAFSSGNNVYLLVTVEPMETASRIIVKQQVRYVAGVRRRVESCV